MSNFIEESVQCYKEIGLLGFVKILARGIFGILCCAYRFIIAAMAWLLCNVALSSFVLFAIYLGDRMPGIDPLLLASLTFGITIISSGVFNTVCSAIRENSKSILMLMILCIVFSIVACTAMYTFSFNSHMSKWLMEKGDVTHTSIVICLASSMIGMILSFFGMKDIIRGDYGRGMGAAFGQK